MNMQFMDDLIEIYHGIKFMIFQRWWEEWPRRMNKNGWSAQIYIGDELFKKLRFPAKGDSTQENIDESLSDGSDIGCDVAGIQPNNGGHVAPVVSDSGTPVAGGTQAISDILGLRDSSLGR